jgi:hypothetical protein
MKTRKFYRDSLEENVIGPIRVRVTSDGHTVEKYKLSNGNDRYFVTISGTHWCAHGNTLAQAVADAIWKDPSQRPSLEKLVAEIREKGEKHKFTLNEFRILTGACLTGCRSALASIGRDESPLTAYEIRDLVSKDWGSKLLSVLRWGELKS